MFCSIFLAPYARTTRFEEAFLPKGKNGLGRFAPSALPHYKVACLPVGKKMASVASLPRPFLITIHVVSFVLKYLTRKYSTLLVR